MLFRLNDFLFLFNEATRIGAPQNYPHEVPAFLKNVLIFYLEIVVENFSSSFEDKSQPWQTNLLVIFSWKIGRSSFFLMHGEVFGWRNIYSDTKDNCRIFCYLRDSKHEIYAVYHNMFLLHQPNINLRLNKTGFDEARGW